MISIAAQVFTEVEISGIPLSGKLSFGSHIILDFRRHLAWLEAEKQTNKRCWSSDWFKLSSMTRSLAIFKLSLVFQVHFASMFVNDVSILFFLNSFLPFTLHSPALMFNNVPFLHCTSVSISISLSPTLRVNLSCTIAFWISR